MYIVKTRACLVYRMNREMARRRLLNVESIARGIGKTELLVRIAKDTGAFIVEPDISRARLFNDKYLDAKFISSNTLMMNTVNRRARILLDEGFTPEMEKQLRRMYRVIGGYTGKSGCRYAYREDGVVEDMLHYNFCADIAPASRKNDRRVSYIPFAEINDGGEGFVWE